MELGLSECHFQFRWERWDCSDRTILQIVHSSSCTLRTCWHRLPDFRRVGNFLKRRYARAVHVNYQDGQLHHGNQARLRSLSMISSKDLVYLVPSPDYCLVDDIVVGNHRPALENSPIPDKLRAGLEKSRAGLGNAVAAAVGTLGRECSRPPKTVRATKAEKRSCRRLCTECGLRVKRYLVEVVSRCNCKFYWCCTVRCKECRQVVEKYYCQR
nr:hypothetical protein BaRGS_028902 [Batillaria attramentaria]